MLPELYQVVFHCSGKTAKTGRAGSKGHGSPRLETGPQLIPTSCSFPVRGGFKSGGSLPPPRLLALNPGFWSGQFKIRFWSLRQGCTLSLQLCGALKSPNLEGETAAVQEVGGEQGRTGQEADQRANTCFSSHAASA